MGVYSGILRSYGGVLLGLIVGFTSSIILGSLSPAGLSGSLSSLLWVYTSPSPLIASILFMGPIALSAAGLSIAYRSGFITVGSEGQVIVGSAAALWLTAIMDLGLHPLQAFVLASVFSGSIGSLLGLLPAVMRIYLGASEILSSLMLNYVVLYIVNYLVSGPWRSGAFPVTKSVPEQYRLGYVDVILISLAISIALYIILSRSRLGLIVEVLGRSLRAAETYGLRPRLAIYYVSSISGFTAGVGGAVAMLSFQNSLTPMSIFPGYGYMGALVAWLSSNNPILALPASWFFSTLLVYGGALQASGLSIGYVLAIQSIIVLSVILFRRITGGRVGYS